MSGLPEVSGWIKTNLREAADGFIGGGTPSTKIDEYWQGNIPWITSKWINFSLYLDNGEKFISKSSLNNCATKIVPKRSLIYATRVGVGKVAINNLDLAINQDLAGILLDEKKVIPEYLAYQLRTERVIQYIEANKRGATIKGVTREALKDIEIYLPKVKEQKKIANILLKIQQAVELQDNLINATQELKKALMQKLFTDGLRGEPQKETEIGLVPESWEFVSIENVAEIKASAMSYTQLEDKNNLNENGATVHGVKVSDMNIEGNEIFFKASNLVRILDKASIKRTIPPYSIIFPKRGAAIATNKKRIANEYTVLDPNLIALIPRDNINYKYLYWWLESFDLRRITEPGPTPQLNKKNIAPVLMPLPTLPEQIDISDAIDSIQDKVEISQAKKKLLTELFNTMLHKLMTAEIRVNDLDFAELEQALAS
jgi:type I restriction enzyme S subunit